MGLATWGLGFFEGEGCSSSETSSTVAILLFVEGPFAGEPKAKKFFVVGALGGSGDFNRELLRRPAAGARASGFCVVSSGGGRARFAP